MKQQKFRVLMVLGMFVFALVPKFAPVYAATSVSVVINEVAWAGSADASTDEWIELLNTTDQIVDLTNWSINDDHGASIYKILSGSISAHGYFLIEDHEAAVTSVTSDTIIDLSLANTGDSLQLFDPTGQLMDSVNSSGAAWFAGDATSKASMERIDALASGDTASNWKTSSGTGEKSSNNSNIVGTPHKINSESVNAPSGSKVEMSFSSPTAVVGEIFNATVKVANAHDLFAYGFDFSYDPAVLHFKSATVGNFLSEDGQIETSFQSALENGTEGKLVVAEARTLSTKSGRNGNGDLLKLQFEVKKGVDKSQIHFAGGSFLATPTADTSAEFVDNTFVSQETKPLDAVANFKIAPGADRYSLQLSWDPVSSATAYRVFRKNVHDEWVLLGEISDPQFTDKDGVKYGGSLIPDLEYHYRVVATDVKRESVPRELSQKLLRGLKGDNNRSDRVDGRDLENLAKHFGQIDGDLGFDALADTTYDGRLDGSDLIDIGANFGRTFTS